MAWSEVGAVADFPEGGPRRVELEGGRALVMVRRGARLWALRDTCPHQGARLSKGYLCGRVAPCRPGEEIRVKGDELVLVCPWHGWEFDVETGRSLVDPERRRVRAYAVRVEEGRVAVDLTE